MSNQPLFLQFAKRRIYQRSGKGLKVGRASAERGLSSESSLPLSRGRSSYSFVRQLPINSQSSQVPFELSGKPVKSLMTVGIPVRAVPVTAALKYMHINWETRCFHFRNQLIELSTVTVRITAVAHVGINVIGYATSLAYSRNVGSPHVASHWVAAQISLLASRVAKDLGSTGGNHYCLSCSLHMPRQWLETVDPGRFDSGCR